MKNQKSKISTGALLSREICRNTYIGLVASACAVCTYKFTIEIHAGGVRRGPYTAALAPFLFSRPLDSARYERYV